VTRMTDEEWQRRKKESYARWYTKKKASCECLRCKNHTPPGRVLCEECGKQTPQQQEWRRKRTAEHLTMGLCRACDNPVVPNGKMCLACLEKDRARNQQQTERIKRTARAKKAARMANDLCTKCNRPIVPGFKQCEIHLKKGKAYRDELKRLNLCVSCTGPKNAEATGTRCTSCIESHLAKGHERKAKFAADGRCHHCGSADRHPQATRCAVCHLKQIASNLWRKGCKNTEVLVRIFERQKGRCPYSGQQLFLGYNASIDHRLPLARGGRTDEANLQWVVMWVNKLKADFLEADFIAMIANIHLHWSEHPNPEVDIEAVDLSSIPRERVGWPARKPRPRLPQPLTPSPCEPAPVTPPESDGRKPPPPSPSGPSLF
jgi:hypothetical protein